MKRMPEDRCGRCAGWERKALDFGTCTHASGKPLTYAYTGCRVFAKRDGKFGKLFEEGGLR